MLEGTRMRMAPMMPALLLAAFLSHVSGGEPLPTFTLSLSPCPGPVESHPGGSWEREIGVILTTAGNPDPEPCVYNRC